MVWELTRLLWEREAGSRAERFRASWSRAVWGRRTLGITFSFVPRARPCCADRLAGGWPPPCGTGLAKLTSGRWSGVGWAGWAAWAPAWVAAHAVECDLISMSAMRGGGTPSISQYSHHNLPVPCPDPVVQASCAPFTPLRFPAEYFVAMAGGRTPDRTPAPTFQDRDNKDTLRAASGARPPVAPRLAPAPSSVGSGVSMHMQQNPSPLLEGRHAPAAAHTAVHQEAVTAWSSAAVGRVATAASASSLPPIATGPLPRHPQLEFENHSTTLAAGTVPLYNEANHSSSKEAPLLSTKTHKGRPTPRRRNSLPAVPSLASVPGLGLASGRVDGSGGVGRALPRRTPLAAPSVARLPHTKTGVSEATPPKTAPRDVPYAEALAGLLKLSGQDKVLGNSTESTRGASLSALSVAVSKMRMAEMEAKSASSTPAGLSVDSDDAERVNWAVAPGAKCAKMPDLAKPLYVPDEMQTSRGVDEAPTLSATPSLRVPPLTRSQKVACAAAADVAKKRANGLTIMVGIRRLLKSRTKAKTGNATKTIDVFPSPSQRSAMVTCAVKDHTEYSETEATDFLLETILAPRRASKRSRDGAMEHKARKPEDLVEPKSSRSAGTSTPSAKLNQSMSHTFADLKRNMTQAWFVKVTGRPKPIMTSVAAAGWLDKRSYSMTPGGRGGIIEAIMKGYKYLGVYDQRVRPAAGAGSNPVPTICFGHYGLGALCVREALECIRDGVSDSGGPDLYRYQRYVDEVIAHDAYLPKTSGERDGILLCDGADPQRAVFEAEFMPKFGGAGESRTAGGPVVGIAETEWVATGAHHAGRVGSGEGGLAGDGLRLIDGSTGQTTVALPADVVTDAVEVAVLTAEKAADVPMLPPRAMAAAAPSPPVAAAVPSLTEAAAAQPQSSTRARAAAILAAAQAEAAALLALADEDDLL